jgi:HTH-type transcriptional regulator/antitoxin HipB
MQAPKTTKKTRSNRSDGSGYLPDWSRALGKAVRARRKSLRLTQHDLSALAGCGPVFLYDLEIGKPTLRLDKVIDVLAILGLQLSVEVGKQRFRIAEPAS